MKNQDAVTYLKLIYGLEPGDLDLTEGEFDIAEVDRVAEKYGLTKREDMSLEKARITLRSLGVKL